MFVPTHYFPKCGAYALARFGLLSLIARRFSAAILEGWAKIMTADLLTKRTVGKFTFQGDLSKRLLLVLPSPQKFTINGFRLQLWEHSAPQTIQYYMHQSIGLSIYCEPGCRNSLLASSSALLDSGNGSFGISIDPFFKGNESLKLTVLKSFEW